MKKFLLLFVMLSFSVTNANAVTTSVKYNNAGVPLTITRGFGPTISAYRYNYGNYAHPSRYARRARPYRYGPRHAQLPPPLMNYNYPAPVQSATTTTTTSVSRLSKDYTVPTPKKSYTMNGVTYYN